MSTIPAPISSAPAAPADGQSSAPTKHIFASKTFWAAVLGMIAMFFPHLFTNLGFTGDAGDYADKITELISFAGIIYGRYKAGGLRFFFN
jgi:hypothetical protein